LQDWADDTVHLGRQHAVLGRDSRFRSFVATFGGDLVRLVPTVEYAAPGGDAELLGVFFADAGQHLEHRSFVDHAVPHCRSNVAYKGALKGDPGAGEAGIARSVWVGDVLIRAAAVGTDTYELNRNLVLTEAARADSVPNLEIETGEISGAGHASATGRFDDEQLFYLQSRGIPADVATRLVVRGFFADVISRLGVPEWEIRLQDRIDAELGLEATGPLDDGPDDDIDTAGSDA
jgi:Fe-S cluster assembly protein SufD